MKILHIVALGIAAIAAAGAAAAEEFEYDVVIRNGRLLDGLGNPWIRGCIASKDGRIARIGRCEGRGRREINARDRYTPAPSPGKSCVGQASA
jgi:N-acyl-D-amino-acid deacylase